MMTVERGVGLLFISLLVATLAAYQERDGREIMTESIHYSNRYQIIITTYYCSIPPVHPHICHRWIRRV